MLRKSMLLAILLILVSAGTARATFPGANGPIVYTKYVEGQWQQVWTAAADGSNPLQLTDGEGVADEPAISPDGKKVAFSWSPADESPQQIGIVNIDGTGQHLITNLQDPIYWAIQPSFSPDGKWIVYVRTDETGKFDIYKIRPDGSDDQRLTDIMSDGWVQWPIYSPDGKSILYIFDESIWKMDADGGNAEVLIEGIVSQWSRPSFSPDGSKIAFASFGTEENEMIVPGGIYLANADGSGITPITSHFEVMPAFSPDGTRISFGQHPWSQQQQALTSPLPLQQTQVVSVSADGSGPRTLLTADDGTANSNGDWASIPVTRVVPKPPAVEQPHKPDSCELRVARTRFFVFKKRNVFRLVARYRSTKPGRVTAHFFEAGANGKQGRYLGQVRRSFQTQGRFRLPKRVKSARAAELRRVKNGFMVKLRIHGERGACEQTLDLKLTDLRRIDRQFVWFMAN